MLVRPSVIALAALLLGPGTARALTLEILHFNDFHSRIQSINKYDSTCSDAEEAEGACFGGVGRLLTEIDARRVAGAAEGKSVIVLNAGDVFQGSLFFTTYSGQAELDFMNRLGLDAMVVGNHEFDLGPGPLADFARTANFPVLFGNADVSQDPALGPLASGPLVLDVKGEKIGIVGAITPETATISTPGPTARFGDAAVSVERDIATLREKGVNRVIVLSHLGAPDDIRLAETVPGIDAIIGGHTHTLFSNTLDGAAYPYPLMVDGPEGAKVPVVSAGAYSKYLGDLTLTFDDAGAVTSASGDSILLDASVIPDPKVLEDIKAYAGPIDALKAKRVGDVAADIDGSRETCRAEECAMGDLVADAMLARVKAQGVTIAIQNGGGLRASIGAGEVSMGDVLAVLPFQNTLSTFNLNGAGIIAALENGVSEVEEGGGRFPQVAGLRFSWDPKVAPKEGRIKEAQVAEGDGWAPIDPAKVYTVVTNNFMRNGGDGYAVFLEQGTNAYDYGPNIEDVVAAYLADHPGYTPPAPDRITRVE
jgi:5'-nucleotidase